jgi:hypothetical protein
VKDRLFLMRQKDKIYRIRFGVSLVILAFLVYLLHWLIFRDMHQIMLYLIGDIAFLFIQVLLVTVIIEQFLNERERRSKFQKLNMVIGAFFSEVGTPLLHYFIEFDKQAETLEKQLLVDGSWTAARFEQTRRDMEKFASEIDSREGKLDELKSFLVPKRDNLLRLLENPTLLEHETFTELLWAVFHLTEELSCRKSVSNLPPSDLSHLSGDIKRAYTLLIRQWLDYMEHLKQDYPYLFSLAVRMNPYNPQARVEVVE